MGHFYLNENNSTYLQNKNDEVTHLQSLIVIQLMLLFSLCALFFVFQSFAFKSQTLAYEHLLTPTEPKEEPVVLGAQIEVTPTPSPQISPLRPSGYEGQATISPTPTVVDNNAKSDNQSTKTAKKASYSIAIYGDSMVDTMGERCEYLEHALKKYYPDVNFTLYNFGKGSENVEMGLSRWNNKLDYQDRHYSSLPEVKPDIIIVGSFAYNPFSPYERDRHWVGLTKMIEAAKTITPNVYVLAEINPLRKDFGKGPNGVNWEESTAFEHSGRIVEQLENAVSLAGNLGVGLIDVFHASIGKSGLNNAGDGIHASITGHEFTADIIAKTISLN